MPVDWNGQEKRKKKRYGVRGSTVQYKKKSLLAMLKSPSARFLVLDMSEGGLHFVTREPLQPGQVLLMDIAAPDREEPVSARGRVVWVRKSLDVEAFHVGVEFVKMSSKNAAGLKNVIENAVLDRVEMSTKVYLKQIDKL